MVNGRDGLVEVSETAVLNANYCMKKLKAVFDLPYDRLCKHEFVLSAKSLKEKYHVSALDIAKGLLDQNIHPPTIYFPLIVQEALMIEPTETETLETLDHFVEVMKTLAEIAAADPDALHAAPVNTQVGRVDEVLAARKPSVNYFSLEDAEMNELKKTVLYDKHLSAGAKMMEFSGWDMPIQYETGIITEHLSTRKGAGIFDVSHMGAFYPHWYRCPWFSPVCPDQ